MEGFLVDNGLATAFDGVMSAHNGLARHFGEVCSKLEAKIHKLTLDLEQAQARANNQQTQANSQELQMVQLAQDLEAARTSLQGRLRADTQSLGEQLVSNQELATELAASNGNLKSVVGDMAALHSKVQSVLEKQIQSLGSELAGLKEQAESQARTQELQKEQQQKANASLGNALSAELRDIQGQVVELVQRVTSAEGRAAADTAAAEKRFTDLSAHVDQIQHESKSQLLPKVKMDIESSIQTFKQEVTSQQAHLAQGLHTLGVESIKQLSDLKSADSMLQSQLKALEAQAAQQFAGLDKSQSLLERRFDAELDSLSDLKSADSMLQSRLKALEAQAAQQFAGLDKSQSLLERRLDADLGSLHLTVTSETKQLLASQFDVILSEISSMVKELRTSSELRSRESMSELQCARDEANSRLHELEQRVSESEAKQKVDTNSLTALQKDSQSSIHNLRTEFRGQLEEASKKLNECHLAAGRLDQVQHILEQFKSHLKRVEERLLGKGFEDCDSAWLSFRGRPSSTSGSRPSRPSSAKSDYGRPLHTFQSYHKKVLEASSMANQQLRSPNPASSSEDRCDVGGGGALGSLLKDLRSEAPTEAALTAMEDAVSLRAMDILSEGLANSLEASVPGGCVPVGAAVVAARAAKD